MRKIIVTRDPAKINLAVLKLVEQLGDLTSLSALASDAEYARSQAVAAAAAAQADKTAAVAAKAGAEAAQASAATSSGTAGAHASAAAASAGDALLSKEGAVASAIGSEAAKTASEGARDVSVAAKDQSQAAKVAAEAARDVVQSSIYIGSTAPPTTRSGMIWVDRTADDLKVRNASNTAWVLLSDFIGTLEYDRAQSLTAPQKAQARTNLGVQVLDAGDGWAHVTETANRAIGVTYTNSTGYPMTVMVNGGLPAGAIFSSVVNGSPTELMSNPGANAGFASRINFYVPAGATYQLQSLTSHTISTMLWTEYKKVS